MHLPKSIAPTALSTCGTPAKNASPPQIRDTGGLVNYFLIKDRTRWEGISLHAVCDLRGVAEDALFG